jgi:hypothetical protein
MKIVNPFYINFLLEILVEKSVDISTSDFKSNITAGLKTAYIAAFIQSQSLFYNTVSRSLQLTSPNFNDIKIYVKDIFKTGNTNPENTKNVVDIRYCVLNSTDLRLIPSNYASDSINLLGLSEMSNYLNFEVKDQAYIETQPRTMGTYDNKLWIIGAVLGPLLVLIILFWIVCFIYYKCINPKKSNNIDAKVKSKRLDESPNSVIILKF